MTSFQLSRARIVGAFARLDAKAPFQRASVALQSTDDPERLLRVHRYVDDGAEGEALTLADWRALLSACEATEIAARPARAGAWLWVIRVAFALPATSVMAQIKARQAVVGEILQGEYGSALIVVESELAVDRAVWVDHASRLAREALRAGSPETALSAAETAFNLDARMSPHRVALLAGAHRKSGHEQRAEGYLAMAERSQGKAFAAEVRTELKELDGLPRHPFRGPRRAALQSAPMMLRAAS